MKAEAVSNLCWKRRGPASIRRVTVHLLALGLFASCASIPRAHVAAGELGHLAAAGPYAVVEYDLDWFDARRDRHVPVHIYTPASGSTPMPVIVFSHGLGNSRRGYGYLGRHWASYGYASIHPEHLGANTDVARRGLWRLFRVGFDRRNWRNVPEDIRFVIDQLQNDETLPPSLRGRIDRARIAVGGHSLGAYGALAVGGLRVLFPDGKVENFRDPRVRAAIPISMSENFNASSYAEVGVPMLHITGTQDSSIAYGTWPRKRRVPFNSIARGDQYLVVIRGANHSTLSDEETSSNRTAHDVIRISTLVFLDAYLRDDAHALAELAGGELKNEIAPVARFSTKASPIRVGKVTIRTVPLFSTAESSRGGFYRRANLLAVKTPESIIRKFLLFHEGEPFDEAKMRESEHNLRNFDFLKSVAITTSPPHDGSIDVTVATQDEWTTDVNVDFSNDGGRSLYDFDVAQKDLFGRGAEVDVRVANGVQRRTRSIELLDPAIFGAYWNGDAFYANNSDGYEARLGVERPLFSYATRLTASATIDDLLQDERIYHDAQVASLFQQHHRSLLLMAGRTLGVNPGATTRALIGLDIERDTFRAVAGTTPRNRDFRFIEGGIDTTSSRFLTLSHVDFGLRQQDFNLGLHAALFAGRSPGGVWRFRSDDSYGYSFTPASFVLTRLTATTRWGPVNRNAVFSSDTRWIIQAASEHPLTFVARARFDLGRDLNRDVQFFADGQNGLRAYPNFAFEGSRRVVFNAEERWFLGHELLQLFEPGVAVFVDTGTATDSPLRRANIRSDFGAGIRFGIARLDSATLRFDLAYGSNRSPLSRSRIVFSFATTQAF